MNRHISGRKAVNKIKSEQLGVGCFSSIQCAHISSIIVKKVSQLMFFFACQSEASETHDMYIHLMLKPMFDGAKR